ncbi:acyl-CoA dehydrogenase family protein [Saccharopolyspora elongata]|uniref:Acyl-CoA dehydrogenase n=1 Tax=Saccharopolyspora elongata TaxID=2530387 RepID=A0A4R4Z450_9PSEU|nr:acyl-CoA dehydrogenase family protein [Saccharopolyspora elongata]TDD52808.1 acyl-CoA dehydrogenase [Saccharopolyspora elongata]
MSLLITAEQRMLQDGLEQLLTRHAPPDSGAELWHQLADELGVVGLCIPEEFGGAGGTFTDLAVVMEAMGRTLYPGPYLSSAVLAVHALLLSEDVAAQGDHLPNLARGRLLGTVIAEDLCEIDGRILATSNSGRVTLSGTASSVLDGLSADLLFVVAEDGEQQSLFSVDPSTAGTTRIPLTSLDLRRDAARVTFAEAPAQRIGPPGAAAEIVPRLRQIASLAIAAEQVGGASRCLDDACEYAKVRYQFGRPIGSFQAVKHACADMYQHVRSGHVAVRHAARCLDAGSPESPSAIAMAKVYCAEAYIACAAANLQIHGGMGFTWEENCHLHYRRARASAMWAGAPDRHRQWLADQLLAR